MAVIFSDTELADAFDRLEVQFRDLRKMRKAGNWPEDPAARAMLFNNLRTAAELSAAALLCWPGWPPASLTA